LRNADGVRRHLQALAVDGPRASVSTTDAIYTHLFQTDFDADMARLDAYVDNAPEVMPIRK
jgi:hypothetical protein